MTEINVVQAATEEYFHLCLVVLVEVLGDAGGPTLSHDDLLSEKTRISNA